MLNDRDQLETLEARRPLDYADPALTRADRERGGDLLLTLGGWRQIALAVGLASLLGGCAYGMWPSRGEAQFWMTVGGLLIGLSLPIGRPARRGRGDRRGNDENSAL